MSRQYDVTLKATLTIPPDHAGGQAGDDVRGVAGLVEFVMGCIIGSTGFIPPGVDVQLTGVTVAEPDYADDKTWSVTGERTPSQIRHAHGDHSDCPPFACNLAGQRRPGPDGSDPEQDSSSD